MKVFVAGAAGVAGQPTVRALLQAGHEVTGTTRSEERAVELRAIGVDAVVCDVLDPKAIVEAVMTARPEVVVHQLTALPKAIDPRRIGTALEATNRLRTEGTRNLVAAALQGGARRMVAQSIAFAYEPAGDRHRDESDPLWLDAPDDWARAVRAVKKLEDHVTLTDGLEGVALRYGLFYGPGSAYASDGSFSELVRKRRAPIVGDGSGVFSFIHVEDAASAVVVALEGARGIFNVVDDDPAPVREWLPELAAVLGAKPPRRIPVALGRMGAGWYGVHLITKLPGASNAAFKTATSWTPRYHSWRQGFREALG